VADSRFRGQPFAAEGRLRVLPDRIADVDVGLRLGTARGRAQGSLGAPGNTLTWSLAVPDMRVVDPAARGRLEARGALHGTWREPGIDFEIAASELRWGERVRAARVSGTGRLAQGPSGRFDLAVDVQSFGLGDVVLDRAQATVEGTRERHQGRLQSATGPYRFDTRLSGSLAPGPEWRGSLQSLQLQGPIAARIEQPVDVEVGAAAARVGPASLQLGAGRIELSRLDWQAPNRFATRGLISGLSLATLQPLVPVPEAVRALVIGARWDVEMGESLNGSLSIARESGDIMLPGSPAVPAKLRSASLEAQAQGAEIVFRAEIDSAAFGSLEAKGTTRASVRDAIWGIAGDAPLDVSLGARMPSLEWAKPLLADRVTLAGRAALDLRIHGTVSRPEYGGEVSAAELRLGVPDLGLTLHDGTVRARFDGQKLAITAVRFVSGTGEINGSGEASLAPGNITARVDLEAAKLAVLSRPDRLVVLSGRTALTWDRSQLKAEGKLTADRGLIELPPQDTPRPSGDVIVLGAKPPPDGTIGIHADLVLDLGNAFELRGRGVSTRLTGRLRAQLSPEGGPALTGTVRAVDGTYTAFGQKLAIQRGALTFAGPVDNPALDILAVRKTSTVEVGVAVGGTALVPQVRLVSTPPMSDADKLAWLTLGRGLSQAGGNEAAVLQAAASALLSRGTSESQGGFPGRVGLDELSVTKESTTGEQIVTLGKRFASNVYLGFEQGVTGAVSVVKVTYDLSRRWSVQARAGTEHAVDIFYTLGFR
ncbi:MAG: hypothetical protein EHM59_15810, partial [Betaproteobacteria bacterium]